MAEDLTETVHSLEFVDADTNKPKSDVVKTRPAKLSFHIYLCSLFTCAISYTCMESVGKYMKKMGGNTYKAYIIGLFGKWSIVIYSMMDEI